ESVRAVAVDRDRAAGRWVVHVRLLVRVAPGRELRGERPVVQRVRGAAAGGRQVQARPLVRNRAPAAGRVPRPVAHVEVAQVRLVDDAVPPALDEAVEPLLDLALGGVRAQRQELVGRRALGVRGVQLSPAAGSVVRAGVDPEELVLRGQPVEQPQVAARVHVRPAAEDVGRDLDPAHLGEDGALLVHRTVERQQARLEHELLLGAVEDLRLHTAPSDWAAVCPTNHWATNPWKKRPFCQITSRYGSVGGWPTITAVRWRGFSAAPSSDVIAEYE